MSKRGGRTTGWFRKIVRSFLQNDLGSPNPGRPRARSDGWEWPATWPRSLARACPQLSLLEDYRAAHPALICVFIEPVRFAEKAWLKVLFANMLREKNTVLAKKTSWKVRIIRQTNRANNKLYSNLYDYTDQYDACTILYFRDGKKETESWVAEVKENGRYYEFTKWFTPHYFTNMACL
jgi:hypothetical protein